MSLNSNHIYGAVCLILMAVLLVVVCTPVEWKPVPPGPPEVVVANLPAGLADCKVYGFHVAEGYAQRELYVVRCPHSDVHVGWHSGKADHYASIVDGS